MSKPAIVTEFRFDTSDYMEIFRAAPAHGGFDVKFCDPSGVAGKVNMNPADLACAAEFFARLAAESSKEPA